MVTAWSAAHDHSQIRNLLILLRQFDGDLETPIKMDEVNSREG
jgi:hypothetical protein